MWLNKVTYLLKLLTYLLINGLLRVIHTALKTFSYTLISDMWLNKVTYLLKLLTYLLISYVQSDYERCGRLQAKTRRQ